MKAKQKLEIKACEQTLLFLDQNQAIVATVPGSAPLILSIKADLKNLYDIDTEVQGLSKVSALSKTQLRNNLEQSTLHITNCVLAYATITENAGLAESIKTTQSELKHKSDIVLRDYAQMIFNTVNPIIATIPTAYLIDATTLTDFQLLINDYGTAIPGPNNRTSRIKNLNENFETTLKGQKDKLKKLDILVNILKTSQPSFCKNYYAARQPQKLAASPRALSLKIVNKADNSPIYKADVSLTEQTSGKIINKTTNKNGTIAINNLAEGVYDGVITDAGYQTLSFSVIIRDGVTTDKIFELELVENS